MRLVANANRRGDADEVLKSSPSRPQASDRRTCGRTRHQRGQSTLELAFALPVLLMLLTAAVGFAVVFNQQLQLTFAVNAGAQLLSISRGQTTDPCQTTANAVFAAAPYLNQSNIKFTIVLGSTTVATSATNPSCSGSQTDLVQSNNATVTLTYPCTLQIFGISVPNCNLSAKTAASIE